MIDNDEYIGIQNLADMLGGEYEVLRRYHYAKGVAEIFEGISIKGKLGLRYPRSSIDKWRKLIELHYLGAVTPKTASAVLQLLWDKDRLETTVDHDPISNVTISDQLAQIAVSLERIASAQEQLASQAAKSKRKKKK